jgi:DNA-binding response OmpR family regulator
MEAPHERPLRVGQLEIRPRDYVALCDGRPLELAPRELALLTELARRQGRIVSREELFDAVWQRPFRPDDRSVDVYVRKLRAKLARARPEVEFIHTHFGFGYRLEAEPSSGLSQLLHNKVTTA